MTDMRDRPASEDEIVVTAEMIRVGSERLKEFALPDLGQTEFEAAARTVFRAMAEVLIQAQSRDRQTGA